MMQTVRTMISICLAALIALAAVAQSTSITHAVAAEGPLRLHPGNPHYFQLRGEPAVLITSGEHYGAVINLDFDCVAYLEELAGYGFNHTRLFTGTYREIPGSFGIQGNTLAPAPQRHCRSDKLDDLRVVAGFVTLHHRPAAPPIAFYVARLQ